MKSIACCPSCKSVNTHIAEWYDDDGETSYYVVCDDCGYEDPDKFEEEFVAVDHWNRRVTKGYVEGDDPTDTVFDKLEEDDWENRVNSSVISDISWNPGGMHVIDFKADYYTDED